MGWILATYRLPANTSRARVAVWRELRRSGALLVQQTLVAIPDDERFAEEVGRLREVVEAVGGQLLAWRTVTVTERDEDDVRDLWNEARDAEYRELSGECAKFLAEIDHEFEIEKFTNAELDEEEAELEKLQRWLARIQRLDIHAAAGGPAAVAALEDAQAALARYASEVFDRTQI